MFLAFLRLLRSLWSSGGALIPAPRARFAPAVEALEDRWLPSTIGGVVYFDANNDGIYQPGEQGIAGNTIQLYNSSGTLLATTVTNSAGQYSFATNPTVAPTAATQEVDATFAPAVTNNTQTQSVAQFNPALGTLESVEISYNGTLTSDLKVENDDAQAATVTGTVNGALSVQAGGLGAVPTTETNSNSATLPAFDGTNDFSGTSGTDFGSQSNSGTNDVTFNANANDLSAFIGTGTVPVTQTAQVTSSISGAGNLMAAVSSQSSGQVRIIYHYETGAPLTAGDYTVVQPSDPAGYVHGLETNNNVAPIPGSDQLNSIAVQLSNSDSLNNNFGERKLSSVSGTVYYDANNDGQFDSGDQPLAGVSLSLTGIDDLGDQITGTVQTGANGSYQFSGLRAGNYVISEVQPAGYLSGATTLGSLGGSISGGSVSVDVPWSATGANYNFGEVKEAAGAPHSGPLPLPPASPEPSAPLMSKRDFIGGAWTQWGW
jgi:protocatechuate 3,4-dioxygenase beta subunit